MSTAFETGKDELVFSEKTLDDMQAHLERKSEWDISIAFYCLREKIQNMKDGKS